MATYKADSDDSTPAPRRKMFGCIGAIVALVLLALSLPLTWYLVEMSRGRRELAVEVQRLRARNGALTTIELNAKYQAAPGDFDAGAALLAALAVSEIPEVNQLGKPLPFVGEGKEPQLLTEAWPEQAAVEEYLARHQEFLTLIESHSAKQTIVRYPTDLTPGINTLLPHIQQLRHGARVLTLQFHVDLRHASSDPQRIDRAIQRLEQTVFLAETLGNDTFVIGQLVRVAIIGVALKNLEYLLHNVTLTDAQLAQLQAIVRQVDMRQGMQRALEGELAMGYTACTWGLLNLSDGTPQPIPNQEIERLAKLPPGRPGDVALMLRYYLRLQIAADESLAAAAQEAEAISQEMKELAGSHRKFFYMQTLLLFPAVQASTNAFLRTDARCRAADAALAALRQRQAKGQWPAQLADLVPSVLPAVSTDPYIGKPLLFKSLPQEFKAYAVGENKLDDGGTWSDRDFTDVGFSVPWREKNQDSEPASR